MHAVESASARPLKHPTVGGGGGGGEEGFEVKKGGGFVGSTRESLCTVRRKKLTCQHKGS